MDSNSLCCAAALSTDRMVSEAVREVCQQALHALGAAPDLALLFASADFAPQMDRIGDEVSTILQTEALLGCTGESIVGNEREIEGGPAVALWLAHLPGAVVEPMQLQFQRHSEGGAFVGWPDHFAQPWPAESALLLLGDPYSFPADALLERMNEEHPGVPILGGMASGAAQPGENRLLLGARVLSAGAVAVRLSGKVRVRSLVSQGCRPIGRPMVITKSERNIIHELGGKPPLEVLNELFPTLSAREQDLAKQGLQLGRVTSEYREHFSHGDFLVRNVVGADPESGSLLIGDYVRTGQTVQFHVRDEQTADDDLRNLCIAATEHGTTPAGALLFTCNGRGTRLFSEADHDARCLRDQWPELPIAGFFAQGEIGPVGPQNFLHGFTASAALIEPVE